MAIDITKFIQRFVEEARDHLNRLSAGLDQLAAGGADAPSINALFRSAHTIKGSARMLKLLSISETAHQLEDVLGALRDGSLPMTAALAQLLHRAIDALSNLVDQLAEHADPSQLPKADAALCQALAHSLSSPAATTPAPTPPSAPPEIAPEIKAATAGQASVTSQKHQETKPSAPPAPTTPPSPNGSAPSAEPKLKAADTVRVRLSKLDELVKLMGEVVSTHARLRQRLQDAQALQRQCASQLDEAAAAGLQHFVQTLQNDVQTQASLMDELHDKTLLMRMLPLAIVLEPAARLVRELARSVGKQVECSVSGAEIELDRQMIDQLSDPITHLIRNAIDHGIEPPEQRSSAGKPAQGRLHLSARQDGGWVLLEIRDDGAGIDLAAVRHKAIKKGLVSAEHAAALSDPEAIDLIFQPGFSTSDIITDLSGRGVGMDVVKQTILDDMQGIIEVDTRAGQGSRFTLRLPLSLAVLRVLLVQVDGQPFCFTAQHVAQIVRLPQSALLQVAQRNAVIMGNELVPVTPLRALLEHPSATKERAPPGSTLGMLLIVLQVRHEKMALQVDALLDEHDMVIKPLPAHMRGLPLVSGMVITGKNELVSVLHAPALLDLARQQRSSVSAANAATHTGSAPVQYHVLVVDDSLNTREIEKDILQAHGYRVSLAEDGQDGYQKAMAETFDAILTDVEMPHLDGFSLTAKLRQEEAYRDTPIIIITSREKEQDKRRGVQVGADAYIVKGDFDQNNLVDTLRALLG